MTTHSKDESKALVGKHTPGPWKYQKPRGPQHAIDRKWEIVSPIKGGGEQVVVGEHTGIECLTEANAALIAAAPELLEALKALCAVAEIPSHDRTVWNQAKQAISRGEGR